MAARSIGLIFGPEDAKPNSATFPDPEKDGQYNDVLAMANGESFDLPAILAPVGLTTPLTAILTYRMGTATSGNIAFSVTMEAVSDGDAIDTDAASSFATINTSADKAVPGTAGYIDQHSVALANDDGIVAGDRVRFRFTRTAASSGGASGDLHFMNLEIQDDGG